LIATFNIALLFSSLKQQNVVALIQGTLPNKAKEQQISIWIFSRSSFGDDSGFRRGIHFAFR